MMTYEVEFSKSAQKELKKFNPDIRLRITKAVYALVSNPRKGNVRPMVGSKSWRLRVGEYRIIYEISDKKLNILIIKVGHRRDIYR
jgi:mRNA interferase RelE/StbE